MGINWQFADRSQQNNVLNATFKSPVTLVLARFVCEDCMPECAAYNFTVDLDDSSGLPQTVSVVCDE